MTRKQTTNLLTFDIEDWYHPTLATYQKLIGQKVQDRVVDPTLRIINMLERTGNKATFFVLGEVAEKFPELVQEMIQKGHEVSSHGYAHDLVYDYTEYQFETDLSKSIDVLERAAGARVLGYRAPSWSLNDRTPWAWDVMSSFGLRYDSSLYPFRTYLYGDNWYSRFAYNIDLQGGGTLREIPPSAVEFLGRRLPFAGGFFLRVAPLPYINYCINQYNQVGQPAVIYLHPWEIDVDQPRLSLPAKERFILYANIERTETKLEKLLEKHRFQSISGYLDLDATTDLSASSISAELQGAD